MENSKPDKPGQTLTKKEKRAAYKREYRKKNKEKQQAYYSEWYQKNKEKQKAYYRELNKIRWEYNSEVASSSRRNLRYRVVQGYGGCCAWCGHDDERVLQLDHVNDDGVIQRGKDKNGKQKNNDKEYRRVIAEGFPPWGQILCANCNHLKKVLKHIRDTEAARTKRKLDEQQKRLSQAVEEGPSGESEAVQCGMLSEAQTT